MKREFRIWLTMVLAGAAIVAMNPARAEDHPPEIARQEWTFGGITGHYDNEQLRRGYLVYKNVCAACHGLRLRSVLGLSVRSDWPTPDGGPGRARWALVT